MNSIILAGGQSRRMGRDKAFLPVGEKFMLQHITDCLRPISDDVIVVTNHAWKVDGLRVQAVPDIVQEWGPLGGILSGLMASSTQYNLVVACDMPLLDRNVLTYLQSLREGYDAVVPSVEGMLHPLHAVYSQNCVEPIYNRLKRGTLKIMSFLKDVNVRYVDEPEVARIDPRYRSVVNVNTPSEYQSACLEFASWQMVPAAS